MPKYPVKHAKIAKHASAVLDKKDRPSEAEPEVEPQTDFKIPSIQQVNGKQVGRLAADPRSLDRGNILALQHAVGNRAVQRMLRESSAQPKAETGTIQRDLLEAGQWQATTKGGLFKKRGGKNPIITELDGLITQYNNPTELNKRTPLQTIIDKVNTWLNNPKNKKNGRRGILQTLLADANNALNTIPAIPLPTITPPTNTPPTNTPPTTTTTPWTRTAPSTTTPSTTLSIGSTPSQTTTPPTTTTTPPTTTPPTTTPPTSTVTTPPPTVDTTPPTVDTTPPTTTTSPTVDTTTTITPPTVDTPVTTPKTFKQEFEEALDSTTLDIPALTLKVTGATATDKETVWSDATLMTKAFGKLGSDEYLTMVTKLTMFQPGVTAEDNSTHTKASEADVNIQTHLSAYVAEAVKSGKKIEGMVGVVAGADWDRAGVAHYGSDVWHNGPPPKTPKKDAINGFVDDKERVWIERNSGNGGTMIHEGLHKYSSDTFLSTLGFNANEGTTEFFTRKICTALTPPVARGNYQEELDVIEELKTAVTEAVLAEAYFDGKLDELKTAFINFRKGKGDTDTKAPANWRSFVRRIKEDRYDQAVALLT